MMKNYLLLLFCAPWILLAQTDLKVESGNKLFTAGEWPAYTVEIPQLKTKEAAKIWDDYARDKGKVKVTDSKTEALYAGAMEPNLSASPMNVYVRWLELTGSVRLTAAIQLVDGQFVSPALGEEKDLAAKKYIRDFAVKAYTKAVKDELKDEQDKLKGMEKELNGLLKDQEKSVKTINEDKRAIEQDKQDILANEQAQKVKMDELTAIKKRIALIPTSSDEELKGALKSQKDMEGEKKKLEKANENLHKDIEKRSKEIREEERNIEVSKSNQSVKQKEIANQQGIIRNVEAKLAGIR